MNDCAVLVVDDEADFREALVERLRLRGLAADGARSGEDALRCLGRGQFDVIVLDVGLPGIDGLEVLARIKQERPAIQVLMLTGHADLDRARRGMDLGAFDYLIKPVGIDELVYRIEDAFETKRLAEGGRRGG
jgi:DNA-binding NtrC family response regulator